MVPPLEEAELDNAYCAATCAAMMLADRGHAMTPDRIVQIAAAAGHVRRGNFLRPLAEVLQRRGVPDARYSDWTAAESVRAGLAAGHSSILGVRVDYGTGKLLVHTVIVDAIQQVNGQPWVLVRDPSGDPGSGQDVYLTPGEDFWARTTGEGILFHPNRPTANTEPVATESESPAGSPDDREPLDVATSMANADSLVGRDIDVKGVLALMAGLAVLVPDQAAFDAIRGDGSTDRPVGSTAYRPRTDLAHLIHVGTEDLLIAIEWNVREPRRYGAEYLRDVAVRIEGTLARDGGVRRIERPRRLRFWSLRADDRETFLGTMRTVAGRHRFVPSPVVHARTLEALRQAGMSRKPRMPPNWGRF